MKDCASPMVPVVTRAKDIGDRGSSTHETTEDVRLSTHRQSTMTLHTHNTCSLDKWRSDMYTRHHCSPFAKKRLKECAMPNDVTVVVPKKQR